MRCMERAGHVGWLECAQHRVEIERWTAAFTRGARVTVDEARAIAERHLRDCMESPDYPVHRCYATCNDLAYLLDALERQSVELERLRGEQRAKVETNRGGHEYVGQWGGQGISG